VWLGFIRDVRGRSTSALLGRVLLGELTPGGFGRTRWCCSILANMRKAECICSALAADRLKATITSGVPRIPS